MSSCASLWDQLDAVVAVLGARVKGDGTHRAHWACGGICQRILTTDARILDEFKGRVVKCLEKTCIGGY